MCKTLNETVEAGEVWDDLTNESGSAETFVRTEIDPDTGFDMGRLNRSTTRTFEEKCTKCRGTGTFYSYTGRPVGPCFTCKGTGTRTFKTSPAVRQARRDNAQQRKADKAQAFIDSEIGQFLKVNDWSDFARSLFAKGQQYGSLTDKQEAAAYRMKAKIDARNAERAERDAAQPDTGLDLSDVPAGRYAVPDGDTRLKVAIQHGKPGSKWEGFTFVKDAAVYGEGQRYGSQRPGSLYKGKIVEELRQIVADPKAASIAYGKLTSTCGVCGRPLEDEKSVAAGIGPVCAQKF